MIQLSTFQAARNLANFWTPSRPRVTKKVRAAAALIYWLEGPFGKTKAPEMPDGNAVDWGVLAPREAVATLALAVDWCALSPNEAKNMADRAISILRFCRYDVELASGAALIAAVQVSSMTEAAKLSDKLRTLGESGELDTELGRGLISGLDIWFNGETNDWMDAATLCALRKAKKGPDKRPLTKSQVARKLRITYRHYHRYETGEAPIPQAVAIKLLDYLVPTPPLLPATRPWSPKRYIKQYGKYLSGTAPKRLKV